MESSRQTTAPKKSRKAVWTAGIFAVLVPLILWYELAHYHAHADAGMMTGQCAFVGIFVNGCLIAKNIIAVTRKEAVDRAAVVCEVISLAVCIAVFAAAQSIPLCPECSQVTAEDLGVLSRWIPGMDMP